MNYLDLRLIKKEFLNKDVYSIYLEKPLNVVFNPGQFYLIKSDSFIDKFARSYSISSSNEDSLLRFSIKLTGPFTTALSNVPEGNVLQTFGPMGKFYLKPDSKKALLVAGGIGVAPFISMLRDNFFKKNRHFVLLYCCKDKSDAAFYDELCSLSFEASNASNKVFYYYSRENSRLSLNDLNSFLEFDEFFTCGPKTLMDFCILFWNSKEIPKTNVRFESFGFK